MGSTPPPCWDPHPMAYQQARGSPEPLIEEHTLMTTTRHPATSSTPLPLKCDEEIGVRGWWNWLFWGLFPECGEI